MRRSLVLSLLALLVGCTPPGGVSPPGTPDITNAADIHDISDIEEESPDILVESDTGTGALGPKDLALFSLTPGKGLVEGGDAIAIHGNGFNDSVVVLFGDVIANQVVLIDSNILSVTTPPGTPGVVDITASLSDGQSAVLERGFRYHEAFGAESVEPSAGPVQGGTPITVTGFGFVPESTILLGGRVAIDVKVVDATTIHALTPEGDAPGPVVVHITTPAGMQSLVDGFAYEPVLQIREVIPPVGSTQGGSVVVIAGGGFTPDTVFALDGDPAILIDVSEDGDEATVEIPAHAEGLVDVTASLTNDATTASGAFYYLDPNAPKDVTILLAVIPAVGPTTGNVPVTAIGLGMGDFFDTSVLFGDESTSPSALDDQSVVVMLPEGDAGDVDVTLETPFGTDTLPNGFRYEALPEISSLSPIQGPVDGGTSVIIKGSGLDAVTSVRVGALEATDIEFDNGKLLITTPKGSPGLSDVRVITETGEAVAEDAFTYLAGTTQLLAVNPDEGAMGGGITVDLYGTDLPTSATVWFGTHKATNYVLLGSSHAQVLCPPANSPSTVDVRVVPFGDDAGDEFTLQGAYTYYNPAAAWGGTWGAPIEGILNVTVLDAWTQDGIEDAFVTLHATADTPYQGWTNWLGHISFTGSDIFGEQMITAWKEGYSASTVVDFDAQNVTVLLFPEVPTSTGGGGGGGGGDPFSSLATIEGKVLVNEKYLIPPPGTCDDKPQDPEGVLCEPCIVDAECGDDLNQCTPMIDGSSYCTTPCSIGADCPSGYACLSVTLGEPKRCMPVAGLVQVRCMTTRKDMFSTNPQPGPGQIADPITGEFTLLSRKGDVGVVCQGELYDPVTEEAVPMAMGATWPITVEEGTVITGVEVDVDTPLTREVNVTFDYPPSNLVDLPTHRMRTMLTFGEGSQYGIHDLSRIELASGESTFNLESLPPTLNGSLDGLHWLLVGGAFGETSTWVQWFPPHSAAIQRNLDGLAENHVHALSGGGWSPIEEPLGVVNALWSAADGHAIAVGDFGNMYRHESGTWNLMGAPSKAHWQAVHGFAADDVYAAGHTGTLAHYDGFVWTEVTNIGLNPRALGGTSGEDLLVVGDDGAAWAFQDDTWAPLDLPGDQTLRAILTEEDALWVVGDDGTVLRRTDNVWEDLSLPTPVDLHAIVRANGIPWVLGEAGNAWALSDNEWTAVDTPWTHTLRGAWVDAANRIHVVGDQGTIGVIDGDSFSDESLPQSGAELRTIVGDGEVPRFIGGQDAVLFGPLLEIPTFESPLSEGILPTNTIQWSADGGEVPDFNHVLVGGTWWKPIWHIVLEGQLSGTDLPELSTLEAGGDPLKGPGIPITVTRGKMQGFSMANFDYFTFFFPYALWDAWAVNDVIVNAQ